MQPGIVTTQYSQWNHISVSLSSTVGFVGKLYEEHNEPRYEISNNVVFATSKGSDQPEHTRSLIRAFASPLDIYEC